MRLAAMVAVAVVVVAIGGCAATEKQRLEAEKEEKISAARMSGRLRQDDPLVVMLSPDERGALERAGMLDTSAGADEALGEDGDPEAKDDASKSGMEQAGDVMIAVLSVVVPLGMAVAPYLLF